MDNTLKEECKNTRMLNNSILFPCNDDLILDVFRLIFNEINKDITEKDIKMFIKNLQLI